MNALMDPDASTQIILTFAWIQRFRLDLFWNRPLLAGNDSSRHNIACIISRHQFAPTG